MAEKMTKEEKLARKQAEKEAREAKKSAKRAEKEARRAKKNKPCVGDPVLPNSVVDTGVVVSVTQSQVAVPAFDEKKAEKQEKEQKKADKKAKKEQLEVEKRARKEKEAFEKAERKRLEAGDFTMYERFERTSFVELEQLLRDAKTREEHAFYRSLLNLRLQIEQEKIIGEVLL